MCGIAGYMTRNADAQLSAKLCAALNMINHRGPDDAGLTLISRDGNAVNYSIDGTDPAVRDLVRFDSSNAAENYIGLGHRRFSIIDTSPAGHQPFWSEDGTVCAAFNGEIYNYVELRGTLEKMGHQFRTRSDTEVLVQAYLAWGVECFEQFVGFWALTLFDRRVGKLLLARDRIGKAPLYVCQTSSALLWCSEIKGLFKMAPQESVRIDEQSVFDFANWQRRDINDRTFYSNIKTFPRASFAWVDSNGDFEPELYWSLPTHRLTEQDIGIDDAAAKFSEIIDDAVRIRLRADVPVASQLSGGMDSSTLLAVTCGVKDSIEAYTVKFDEAANDEEPFARLVAERYRDQVDYNVVEPPAHDLLDNMDEFVSLMEMPFHSPNQFTSHRIWKIMSDKGLRVVLYGAGGDEVFAGYRSDYFAPYLRLLLARGELARFTREFFTFSEYSMQRHIFNYAYTVAKMIPQIPTPADNGRIRFVPTAKNPLVSSNLRSEQIFPPKNFNERLRANMQEWRMNYWLRIDNQNSLGVPVELRSPFLDHRLVEFAFSLPESYLIRNGWLKWIVRYAMRDKLPKEIVWRRQKIGFPFPLKTWLVKNRSAFESHLKGIECPYVDVRVLMANYDELAQKHAEYTWGLISILLWWKNV